MEAKQFKKRNAILACLQSTKDHPSAEMVYQLLQAEHPDISMATVYRNLSRFKEQGLITSLGTVNGIERFDAEVHPHVHFICGRCSAVRDMPGMEPPQALCQQVSDQFGFQVDSCALTFSGLCRDCRD